MIETQEFQDAILGWQGDGHCTLGRQRNNYVGHFTRVHTITDLYCATLLDQLRSAIREERRSKLSKVFGVLSMVSLVCQCRSGFYMYHRYSNSANSNNGYQYCQLLVAKSADTVERGQNNQREKIKMATAESILQMSPMVSLALPMVPLAPLVLPTVPLVPLDADLALRVPWLPMVLLAGRWYHSQQIAPNGKYTNCTIGGTSNAASAKVHNCKVSLDAVERNGYSIIPYLASSPDLTFWSRNISFDAISGPI